MTRFTVLAAALLLAPSAALAQDSDPAENRDIRVRVGLGGQVRPNFIGADQSEVVPLVRFSIARGDKPFRFSAADDGFGIPIVTSGGFAFGPVGQLQSGRRDSEAGVPIGRIKRTLEAGAFAEWSGEGDSIRVRGELRKGIGGHEGLIGQLGVDKIWRDGDKYVVSVGPRVLVSDGRYQRAWFGVSPEAALATGLPAYRPGGGVHAVGVTSGLNLDLGNRFGLFGYARYERLVGDAARSPFIREHGSRNQLAGGLGLNYTFRIRR